jgi:hypothetical protein
MLAHGVNILYSRAGIAGLGEIGVGMKFDFVPFIACSVRGRQGISATGGVGYLAVENQRQTGTSHGLRLATA